MHTRSRLLAAAVVFWIHVNGSVAWSDPQQPGPARTGPVIDVTRLGPQVGEKVPDFTLPDQAGRRRSLSSLMGEQGLVLVFSRSADW